MKDPARLSTTDLRSWLVETSVDLLSAGFEPLRNTDKRCFVEDWGGIEITEEWLRQRRMKEKAVGLRVRGDLMAFDLDVSDEDLVGEILAVMDEVLGKSAVDAMPVRHSGKAKIMLFARCEEPFRMHRTARFLPPGSDPHDAEADDHMVEIFGPESGKQVAVYGAHTTDENGDVTRWYGWDNDYDLVAAADSLPVLERTDIERVALLITDRLEDLGWVRAKVMSERDGEGGGTSYDLPTDAMFVTKHGEVSYGDLVPGDDSVRMLEITGEGTNPSRGVVYERDGWAFVWDSQDDHKHFPAAAEKDLEDKLGDRPERLGQKLIEIFGEERIRAADEAVYGVEDAKREAAAQRRDVTAGEVDPDWSMERGCEHLDGWELMEAYVENLADRYALYPTGTDHQRVVDLMRGTTMKMGAFREMLAGYALKLPAETPQGKETTKMVSPVDGWLSSPRRVVISGYRFTPGDPRKLIPEDDGEFRANTYRPPEVGVYREDYERLWERFLAHLIANETERRWFENWLAYKIQNLACRGAFVLFVSHGVEGTGRNTLFEIVGAALGNHQVHYNLMPSKIMSSEGQGAYADWKLDHLLVTINELTTTVTAHGSANKRKLTEAMKANFEPSVTQETVSSKFKVDRRDNCYVSALAATNHEDALVLDPATDNRRFAILDSGANGPLTGDPDLMEALSEVRQNGWVDPDMVATLLARYSAENWGPASPHDFMTAPDTERKQDMSEASRGAAHPYALAVLKTISGPFYPYDAFYNLVLDRVKEDFGSNAVYMVRQDLSTLFAGGRAVEGWRRTEPSQRVATSSGRHDREKVRFLYREELGSPDFQDHPRKEDLFAKFCELQRSANKVSGRDLLMQIPADERKSALRGQK